MFRECAMLFFCLLISVPVSAASVASGDALVVDREWVKTDGGRIKNKAWGQSSVEVQSDGETKIISAAQGQTTSKRVVSLTNSDSVAQVSAMPVANKR